MKVKKTRIRFTSQLASCMIWVQRSSHRFVSIQSTWFQNFNQLAFHYLSQLKLCYRPTRFSCPNFCWKMTLFLGISTAVHITCIFQISINDKLIDLRMSVFTNFSQVLCNLCTTMLCILCIAMFVFYFTPHCLLSWPQLITIFDLLWMELRFINS